MLVRVAGNAVRTRLRPGETIAKMIAIFVVRSLSGVCHTTDEEKEVVRT